VSADPPLRSGWVAPALADEFPHLGLTLCEVEASAGRTSPEVRARLRALSDRFTGARAVTLRREPVPWAYRVFFRQVGIDPDERRTPIEQIALDRMFHGGFKSLGRVDDALLIATLETAVPVLAFDAARVEGNLGLRLTERGERLGADGRTVAGGQVAVADAERALGILFGDRAEGVAPSRDTERIVLAAVRVKGVPGVSVEEALWSAVDLLRLGYGRR
jgi:DNA/RNA-binding domain of Phe-tRNA-synthetase-like protein